MSDFRHTTGKFSQREAQQSDQRPRSVNKRVMRSDDELFEYDDDTVTPVGGRSITADVVGNATTASNGVPAGTVIDFAGTSAPTGYLACDGAAVSRTTYADLFTAVGTTWGVGDGSTTFNLPDMRGAVARGTGSHGSETMADGNAYTGPSVGSFEDDQMQGHNVDVGINTGGSNQGDGENVGSSVRRINKNHDVEAGRLVADGTNGSPRTGDETRMFAAGLLKCVKT